MNLRDLAEQDLAVTLEGDWSTPVALVAPDGAEYTDLKGQVLYDLVRMNPENGERTVCRNPIVSLRRSSLPRIPVAGETWLVTLSDGQYVISPTRPPEGGESLGFIRLYLQAVEQTE